MKNYEDLCFTDDFMFCKILQENEDLCKELTELILGRKIRRIVKTEKQKAIQIAPDGHGVRFDVYFTDDEMNVYDIEMQKSDTKELPLRSRYYQGMIDLDFLAAGKEYKELPHSYVIFLCKFDLFKRGYHKYSFVPKCKEVENLLLDDKTDRVFICSGGDKNDVSDDMKNFIDYLAGITTNSDLACRLEEKVKEAIEKSRWRKEYMTLQEMMQDEFEEGKKQGIEQGIEQGTDRHLINLICKKLCKGKDIETIADEVEEDLAVVRAICDIAGGYAPDYDVDAIYNALKAKEKLPV
ncbi:Rpn family recombination-promoting nuclease/putative transposase [Butyrivibrio sp. AE3004]|uniref:Rpn family recombination-promoting nuclease/putative transposase n=1 Tax=Butyrivibrio sp. AE3004 TaxID=1506994 RepID=UPI00068AD20E|nr:Rpn family recombination-promoting nuclease/putative transposase [Butyrivibrio sp. AE3004]